MKCRPKVKVRELFPSDRETIKTLLARSGFFEPYEIEVALELIDMALTKPDQKDYFFGVAEKGGSVVGYCCFGPTPITLGTYDIYWICVDPSLQREGTGKILMEWVESQVLAQKGRIIVVETSGRDLYKPTRSFYLKIGYHEEARIRDFYRPGDDRVIFTKIL